MMVVGRKVWWDVPASRSTLLILCEADFRTTCSIGIERLSARASTRRNAAFRVCRVFHQPTVQRSTATLCQYVRVTPSISVSCMFAKWPTTRTTCWSGPFRLSRLKLSSSRLLPHEKFNDPFHRQELSVPSVDAFFRSYHPAVLQSCTMEQANFVSRRKTGRRRARGVFKAD